MFSPMAVAVRRMICLSSGLRELAMAGSVTYFRRVGLVRKLRETRAMTGFSRLVPKSDRADPAVQPLSINGNLGWLPAIEVRGEGIFVEINADAIEEWIGRAALLASRRCWGVSPAAGREKPSAPEVSTHASS